MEDVAIDALAEEGIDGKLDIHAVSETQAVINNISLSENGTEFFSSEQLTIDYAWRDMIKGRSKRIVLTRPKGRITLNSQGKIIDSWLPEDLYSGGKGESETQILPPNGIEIKQGGLHLLSPFGTLDVKIDGTYIAADNFNARINIAPTKLDYADWNIDGGGDINVTLKGQNPHIKTKLNFKSVNHPVVDAENIDLNADMIPVIENGKIAVTGESSISFSSLKTAHFSLGDGQLNWDGDVNYNKNSEQNLSFKGDWSSDIKNLSIPDPIRRAELAQTLSLSEPLSNTPIAQNFGPALTTHISQLLTQSSLTGSGKTELNGNGVTLSLNKPLTLTSINTSLTLKQRDWGPLYKFDRKTSEIQLAFHADLTNPAGFSLREANMTAHSNNGWRLNGVKQFSADISTEQEWKTIGLEQTAARLSPFTAHALYRSGETRELKINGAINYDGAVPGAVVSGLKAGGDLTMQITDDESVMHFMPKNSTPLSIARIETDTEWRAEDVTGQLITHGPLYRRKGNQTEISATLADLQLIMIDRSNERNLGISFNSTKFSGKLVEKNQHWDIDARGAKICSEDTPGPGTVIRMPDMTLALSRAPDKDIRFTMSAPTAHAKTQLVSANDLRIEAEGTPNDFNLNYSPGPQNKGRVKFTGDALPSLPMTGVVNYTDGAFMGDARTHLPFGEETPINVSYRFSSGTGTASVDIPELRFSPDGLQPQSLVKALKGKIAEVDGTVSAQINLAFAAGQPLQSSGTAQLKSMNFGTLPGPLTDVNTELSFSSFFPLQSQGRQTLTVAQFDPGFPLENGTLEFELIPDGVKVYSAHWPLGTGAIELEPFDWLYSAAENRVVMRMDKVSLGNFLDKIGEGSLQATGDIEGRLPIIMSGVEVKVDQGHLSVKDGGTIRYQTGQTNAAGASNEYAKMAFDALKDFRYRSLIAKLDGPLDGAIEVGMEFEGSNKDVLNNQPFLFNINIEGELLNIVRSFNTNAQIKSELARRQLERSSLPAQLE